MKPLALKFVAMFSGIVNIIADFYFVFLWKGTGAAIATFLVVLISSVMEVAYYLYKLKKNIDRMFE